jgi:DNA-binding HxlR family transcriptional regulator
MRGYGQMCPVARASEIFAERWTPLILREILAGRQHFNEIQQGLHRISPSVLGARLRALEQAGIIERGPNPSGRGHTYHLTKCGADLGELVEALGVWGQRWLELRREHLNAEFLMWRLYTQLQVDQLPRRRVVIRFRFQDEPRAYWLVLRRPDPDLCFSDPGFDEDLAVDAELEALTRVYLGHMRLADAIHARLVQVEGDRQLVRAFPHWIGLSHFAAHAPLKGYHAPAMSTQISGGVPTAGRS